MEETQHRNDFNKWRWQWRRQVAIAQGTYSPATVLAGGTVVNVFTEELIEADVAIDAGRIVGIGAFPDARERIDVTGKFIAPSFVEPHLHLESSMLWAPEFARVVVPHGTGAVVTDPHEIANVAGVRGIDALRRATRSLPLDIYFTAPSCVPASDVESPGFVLSIEDIEMMLEWPETVALGELMDFPGVLHASAETADKLWASRRHLRDGHAPGLRGTALQAYAGSGVNSDHESLELEEAREKLRAGMLVMMRQGSSEKNLLELLPLVTDATYPRMTFASDDRDCHDLLTSGHIDDILRIAISAGLDPVRAIRMATITPAQHYRLTDIGAVAPGYRANLVVLDDLARASVAATLHNGRFVARDGVVVSEPVSGEVSSFLRQSVNVAPVRSSHLTLPESAGRQVVEIIPDQIVTRFVDLGTSAGVSVDDDLLKLVCAERHHATGRIGVGLVRGMGLCRGAIASTLAHDAHNIVAVGTNDPDILAAISLVAESQGGLAVVADGAILAHLDLPIAGLMSDQPAEQVAAGYSAVETAARTLGSTLRSPFGQLVFLALSVIPEARITDRGVIRVGNT